MMRLVFSDLRDHAATWIGALAVAVACGYIGGWVVSLQATAGFSTDALQKFLQNAASSVLLFSLVAAVAVLVSAANLTVSAQRRSYALWQLANVRPALVSAVVLVQLGVVARCWAPRVARCSRRPRSSPCSPWCSARARRSPRRCPLPTWRVCLRFGS